MALLVLEAMDLAALLCSRVCHDVINPVGAIVNGLEVLEDKESDASTREFALDLIKKSSKSASARLSFARVAFGAAGSAGSSIDLGDAENAARNFIQDDKTTLVWTATRVYMPKNKVKLLMNLIVVGAATMPRGGTLEVVVTGAAEMPTFMIKTSGPRSLIPHGLIASLAGEPEGGTIDSHSIQPFYAGLLARAAGMSIEVVPGDGMVTIHSAPVAASQAEAA